MPVRLAHFSDVHLTANPLGWRVRDLFTKRLLGILNVKLLGRGHRFQHAPMIVDAMMTEIRDGDFDQIVFSGDATTLAFESEFGHAARRLGVGTIPGVTVPGNHDYYTARSVAAGAFERHFAPWLDGERVDGAMYPFAKRVGHVWLICVNSSYPRPINIGASSTIGSEQLNRLRVLCSRLDPGPRVLVTHYPLRTAAGKVERRSHRLLDHKAALDVAKECGIGLWLHGHIHTGFVLPASDTIPFPVICAGSATQLNRWSYNLYSIEGTHLTMQRRVFDLELRNFCDGERYEMQLG